MLSNPSRWSKTSGPGNILICDDAVFTLNNRQLNGHFEWESLVERSRASLASEPESQELANALAKLLCERGKAEISRDRKDTALAIFDEARALLEVERDISPSPRDKNSAIYHVLIESCLLYTSPSPRDRG